MRGYGAHSSMIMTETAGPPDGAQFAHKMTFAAGTRCTRHASQIHSSFNCDGNQVSPFISVHPLSFTPLAPMFKARL